MSPCTGPLGAFPESEGTAGLDMGARGLRLELDGLAAYAGTSRQRKPFARSPVQTALVIF